MAESDVVNALKTDWSETDYYNFEDLNRVEETSKIINEKILEFRGENLTLTHVLNRDLTRIEFADDLNRVENNLSLLRANLNYPTDSTDLKTEWTYNQPFSYIDANRLEHNAKVLYWYIKLNLASTPYTGNYTVGQEGVI